MRDLGVDVGLMQMRFADIDQFLDVGVAVFEVTRHGVGALDL